jgi:carboxyl-terminal processing protease
MRRSRKIAVIAALLVPVVTGGFLLQARGVQQSGLLLEQVLGLVANRFVDTLSESNIYERAARGLVKELNDPYSELLSPRDMKQFNSRTAGKYAGLGMLIEQQEFVTVSKVYPNTPAERGGVREGDRIIMVDTTSTRGWTTSQVSDVLLGQPGTKVKVRFARHGVGTPIDLTFERALIKIPAVPYTLSFAPTVGYIPLQTFNENATEETQRAIQALSAAGAKGIILDMRQNPGGILDQAQTIASLFLKPNAQIATVRGRNGESQSFPAEGQPVYPTAPMIVLVDEYSASASEIVAGALQDHDRALILGQTTFGKGLVQSVYNLEGGYALKLTTAKWFTPSGRSIQRERKSVDGRFVEEAPDTNETEASKKARPAFKSTAGRVVYGGGGVTPDLIVKDDTLSTVEQQFVKTIAAKAQDYYQTLYDYGLEVSKTVAPNFEVQPAWRDEFYKRLSAKGVVTDRAAYDAARRYIDRELEQRVTRFAVGDSAAKRRDLKYDAPLRRAIDMLTRSTTQAALFQAATVANGSVPPKN